MRFLILYILFFPIFTIAQDFELKKPNVVQLKEELQKTNHLEDVVYIYLKQNYKSISEKFEVKKLDYSDNRICAFKQKFAFGIIYSEEQCREAGGIEKKLILPKIHKESLIEWVELIFESSPMDIEHGWNNDKTIYDPIDSGAGCYFEIKDSDENIKIDIYCGC